MSDPLPKLFGDLPSAHPLLKKLDKRALDLMNGFAPAIEELKKAAAAVEAPKEKPLDLKDKRRAAPKDLAQAQWARRQKEAQVLLPDSVANLKKTLKLKDESEVVPALAPENPPALKHIASKSEFVVKAPAADPAASGSIQRMTAADKSNIPGVPDDIAKSLGAPQTSTQQFVSNTQIENVAFHEFASYQYVFEPWLPVEETASQLSNSEQQLIATYVRGLSRALDQAMVVNFLTQYASLARRAGAVYLSPSPVAAATTAVTLDGAVAAALREMIGYMQWLYAPLKTMKPRMVQGFLSNDIHGALRDWASRIYHYNVPTGIGGTVLADLYDKAVALAHKQETASPSVALTPYPAGTVNLGLRVLYRQEWKSLGNQFGDVVRTIPLGPRQSDKVSIKIVRRNKATRQLEKSSSEETSSEISDSVKDSSEVVEDAASSNKWHADAEASGSFDLFGGEASVKVSGGMSGESSASSKDTKSKLAEHMQKTAHKMRRDSKVTVSTETENTYEEQRSSEIVNPNDEVAITYIYQRLQRQYEVHTYLSQVDPVIFVAEEVPGPGEEDIVAWIKRYGWIVSKVLLDESFRAPLNTLINDDLTPPPAVDDSAAPGAPLDAFDDTLKDMKASLTSQRSTAAATSLYGGVLNAAHDSYLQASKERTQQRLRMQAQAVQYARLIQHFQDNILHYCRSVWSQEDPEQRMMRYAEHYVPMSYRFVVDTGGTMEFDIEGLQVPGRFVVDPESTKFMPLSDIINPAGPVGYSGNYAVYNLRSEYAVGQMMAPVQYLMRTYMALKESILAPGKNNTGTSKPALTIDERYAFFRRYKVIVAKDSSGKLTARPFAIVGGNQTAIGSPVNVGQAGASVKAFAFTLTFPTPPADKDEFNITLTYELRDPELAQIEEENPLPAAESSLFTDEVLADMLQIMPGLSAALGKLPEKITWSKFDSDQQTGIKSVYHEYLMRKEHTVQFVVDTNSLVLNLMTGEGSTLEPFKRAHRYLDVMKAATEVARRQDLLDNNNYASPDIQKVVVIGQDAQLQAAVVGSEAAGAANGQPAAVNGNSNGSNGG